MNHVLAQGRSDILGHAHTTWLSLETADARIEWLIPPPEDVLARLILELIGVNGLKEIFGD